MRRCTSFGKYLCDVGLEENRIDMLIPHIHIFCAMPNTVWSPCSITREDSTHQVKKCLYDSLSIRLAKYVTGLITHISLCIYFGDPNLAHKVCMVAHIYKLNAELLVVTLQAPPGLRM